MNRGVHYILNALHLDSWGVWVLASYCSFPAVLGVSRRMRCDHLFPNANLFAGSGDNVVNLVKRLQTVLSGVWIPAGRRNLSLLQKDPDWLWSSPSLHWNGCRGSFPWVKRVRDKRLTAYPPVTAKFKNEWSYTFIPPYAFMACIGTILPLSLPFTYSPFSIIFPLYPTSYVTCWNQSIVWWLLIGLLESVMRVRKKWAHSYATSKFRGKTPRILYDSASRP